MTSQSVLEVTGRKDINSCNQLRQMDLDPDSPRHEVPRLDIASYVATDQGASRNQQTSRLVVIPRTQNVQKSAIRCEHRDCLVDQTDGDVLGSNMRGDHVGEAFDSRAVNHSGGFPVWSRVAS